MCESEIASERIFAHRAGRSTLLGRANACRRASRRAPSGLLRDGSIRGPRGFGPRVDGGDGRSLPSQDKHRDGGGQYGGYSFDTVGHGCVRELLGRRVQDGVITRLIGKWLKAGVWEEGRVSHPQQGTPQGGVVTPRTHLATLSSRSVCHWCEGRSSGIDNTPQEVLFMCPIESSLLCATLPAREPSFPTLAGKRSPSRGGSALGPQVRDLRPASAPIRSARAGDAHAFGDSGRQGGVHGEVAARLDPASSRHGATAWRTDQRLGCRSIATSAGGRFAKWLKLRARRDSRSGLKPWEIVWQRGKWRTRTGSWCRGRILN